MSPGTCYFLRFVWAAHMHSRSIAHCHACSPPFNSFCFFQPSLSLGDLLVPIPQTQLHTTYYTLHPIPPLPAQMILSCLSLNWGNWGCVIFFLSPVSGTFRVNSGTQWINVCPCCSYWAAQNQDHFSCYLWVLLLLHITFFFPFKVSLYVAVTWSNLLSNCDYDCLVKK